MRWRDSLVEDFSCGWIDAGAHPSGPCGQCLGESLGAVHVLQNLVAVLNKVPSAPQSFPQGFAPKIKVKERKELWMPSLRLGGSPGRPPMPCVEDEHVGAEPDLATLYRIEVENPSNLLADNVH